MSNYRILFLFFLFCFSVVSYAAKPIKILNVSYDATREFYESYNKYFMSVWKQQTGEEIEILQSHAGSGTQARAVIDGLAADVVTLALAYDIDLIAERTKLLPINWQQNYPNNSCPYTSTILFLVRSGNPKHITDWSDLIRKDVQVITPNPKTSGGARWNYMAAWGYALKKYNGNEQAAKNFMKILYHNVPVLDAGARGAANTFVQRNVGDVLIAWENEAYLVQHRFGRNTYEVIRPSLTILAEPPVALLPQITQKKGTTEVAKAYLQTLYTLPAQDLIARFFYRPSNPMIASKYIRLFPQMNLVTINEFGGWKNVIQKHFANGGIFDQIYQQG